MLLALLALYLFSLSDTSNVLVVFDHVKASIKEDIGDKACRAELLSIIDDAENVTKEEWKRREKIFMDLLEITEKHGTKTETVKPVLAKLREETETYQDRMIRYRFALKEKMTREEWVRVFPREERGQASE